MLSMLGLPSLIKTIIEYIMPVIAKLIPDQDKLAEIQGQLEGKLLDNQAGLFKSMSDVMIADSSSVDKYTSRARPTVVYWSVGAITIIAVLGLFDMAGPVLEALKAVPEKLWDLMTYGIGAYVLGRTGEKLADGYFESKKPRSSE